MNSSNVLLLNYLNNWYDKHPENLKTVIDIVSQDGDVSLRILDWFVTNYAKDFNITLDKTNVHEDYKLMLWSYKKKRFDPFCRDYKTNYHYTNSDGESQILTTSCGQLCFFKWCFEKRIIDYVKQHHDTIEKDMKQKTVNLVKKDSIVSSRKSIKKNSRVKHIITFH
jgi:hypothetical protein